MSDKIEIYTAGIDKNGEWYVDGPGDGMNYHSGVLWPELRCKSEEEAIRGAKIANVAYNEGMEDMKYSQQICPTVKNNKISVKFC